MSWAPKDSGDVLDYVFDWTEELAVETDTIASSVWSFTGDDVLLVIDSSEIIAPASVITRVWLSGGTAGVSYNVKNVITVASGPPTRVYERYAVLKVKDVKVS